MKISQISNWESSWYPCCKTDGLENADTSSLMMISWVENDKEEENWFQDEEGSSSLGLYYGLNPQDSFDPDLDEVDEKFIDSLLNSTTPIQLQQQQNWSHNTQNNSSLLDYSDFTSPPIQQQQQYLPLTIPNQTPPKKPQFRWRRRKRRSKAQYPEMSQYLLPIDSGDEVQHLGRTLECTLCGLRGKRCHLTLHFKAKHAEVIEFDKGSKNSAIHGASQATHTKRKPSNNGANNNNKMNNGANTSNWTPVGKYKILDLEEALALLLSLRDMTNLLSSSRRIRLVFVEDEVDLLSITKNEVSVSSDAGTLQQNAMFSSMGERIACDYLLM
ncbi:unnamed protein product [Lepeophtheirus salmonis]|uniref:(salmon louse) hypothetical protein n=1 Tax=Lepeophtheirus salmonis TaxID=72036 RepID=A0A7R8CH00_LEPSM|nr:unnamed protein product [Lepeophtheirus salmonis]CAF2819613.1 unnamed protein product [Lepeophtheirus salmonis]